MIALRPRDQHVWDPRPLPHETETETETKKWSRDHVGLETLTSLGNSSSSSSSCCCCCCLYCWCKIFRV